MEAKLLEKFGLEKEEAEIYIALLKNGTSTVMEVSRNTKLERTSCYRILEKLIDKGLATFVIENNSKTFMAVEPDNLLAELKEKEQELINILPKLKGLVHEKTKEPKIQLYKGENGLTSLGREILTLKEDYVFFNSDWSPDTFLEYSKYFVRAIEKNGIHERILTKEGTKIPLSKNSEVRYLPKSFPFKAITVVWADKVVFVLWTKPFLAIAITDKDLAETHKSYFEILWKIGKRN